MAAADFFAFFLPKTEAELLGEAANLPKTPTIQRGLEEDRVLHTLRISLVRFGFSMT